MTKKEKDQKPRERTPAERWDYMRERIGQLTLRVSLDAAGDSILERLDYYPRMTQVDPDSVDAAVDAAIEREENAA